MPYCVNFKLYNSVFAVPKQLIDRYLPNVCSYYLKVLLYFLRYQDDAVSDVAKIANDLSLSKDDVKEAVDFWIRESVIISSEKECSPLSNEDSGCKTDSAGDVTVRIVSNRPPTMSSAEMAERIENNNDLRFVLERAEGLFGRPLSTSEQRSIISIIEWMAMPSDVLLMLFEYCRSLDKINMRYIEKVASNWCDLDIMTHESAEKYIARVTLLNEQEKAVRSCCGVHDRNLSSNEKKYIEIWFDEYHFSIDMIRLAFEKTVDNIGKISFTYMHKILKQWFENKITNPELAESYKGKTSEKKNSSYDLDVLDRIGLEVPEL